MVGLKVWYEHPDDPTADPFLVIGSPGELDAFIDRVREETKGNRCPPMVQAVVDGGARLPILQIGLGQDKGFVGYSAKDGGWTRGMGSEAEIVEYVYMGNLTEIKASVEVSIETVRQGLHEFMATGQRPSIIDG